MKNVLSDVSLNVVLIMNKKTSQSDIFSESFLNESAPLCLRDRVGQDDVIGTAVIPINAVSAAGEDG